MAERARGIFHGVAGPGPYTLANMVRTTLRFGPQIIEHRDALASTVIGDERLPMDVRIAFHLRLARLMGCPVCLRAFPALGRAVGLTRSQIEAASGGRVEELPPKMAQVVTWTAAVAEARGEMPLEWPDLAREMTMREREQVLILARLELVIHSIGLLVVPKPLLGDASAP